MIQSPLLFAVSTQAVTRAFATCDERSILPLDVEAMTKQNLLLDSTGKSRITDYPLGPYDCQAYYYGKTLLNCL